MKTTYLFLLLLLSACTQKPTPPAPYGPTPSEGQLSWHQMEYFSLICYGLNTYTEEEWAYGDVDTQRFNPSDLDTDQWAKVAHDAGMKGLILVAKHHDGFCLWPSQYTDYSVKSTPWKNGEGDVLGDLAASCKKYGLKLGVYLSPWDRNHPDYGQPEYVDYYYKQLEELMTNYGEIFEFWIDGANGGTGYYGGANEHRNIDRKSYYGYDEIFSIVKRHQPNAVIFSDVGPGTRWVGNEAGIGSETNWNRTTTNGKFPGESSPEYTKKLGTGDPDGTAWIPAEVNTTLLWPKAWYFHTGHQPRSLSNLMDLYYTSIGRGSPLNLGLAIAPTGKIRDIDAQALLNFKKQVDREFADNLVLGANIQASDYRNKQAAFVPDKCLDEDSDTYWATTDSVQQATLEIDFQKPVTFNRLLLQECIALGQRIHEFALEVEENGEYRQIVNGTTVGYKRIVRFDAVKTSKARITLKTEAPCLTLSNLGFYNAPRLVADPIAHQDIHGKLHFNQEKGISVFYALKESTPTANFTKYSEPIDLSLGGRVYSYAKDEESGFQTDILINQFGIARDAWKISTTNLQVSKEAQKAIDNNPQTFYIGNASTDLIIDLNQKLKLNGFSYLPRQDGEKEGIIYEYAFFLSSDGKNWEPAKAEGTFSNIENNPIRQIITFDSAETARFIKLVAKSDIRQSGQAAFAEIEVFVKQ